MQKAFKELQVSDGNDNRMPPHTQKFACNPEHEDEILQEKYGARSEGG